ncbi:hypothetical protein PCANC_16223 [Puccinia coronata f. sp. avenae]|uniref:Mitochondrial inner membrane protease subunit n=1 Tax=Puccinia coronata f. sp. avenae TaxID=200324 RepID=A0A2N5U1M3_9BASI|nr:hypothetical protein PCANC_16223 [Puccinia coronata f. sp. avenae]
MYYTSATTLALKATRSASHRLPYALLIGASRTQSPSQPAFASRARPSSSSTNSHPQHPLASSPFARHRRFTSFLWSRKTWNLLLWVPVLIVIHEHGFGFVRVSGRSMQPTFNPDTSCLTRDVVLVNKFLGDKSASLKRGDIITFKHPEFPEYLLTKRILGLEGDVIKREKPSNSGAQVVRVPMGHCWVEGDEPFHSEDSHRFGPIPLGLVTAKVVWIVWPISRFGAPAQGSDQSHRTILSLQLASPFSKIMMFMVLASNKMGE